MYKLNKCYTPGSPLKGRGGQLRGGIDERDVGKGRGREGRGSDGREGMDRAEGWRRG